MDDERLDFEILRGLGLVVLLVVHELGGQGVVFAEVPVFDVEFAVDLLVGLVRVGQFVPVGALVAARAGALNVETADVGLVAVVGASLL